MKEKQEQQAEKDLVHLEIPAISPEQLKHAFKEFDNANAQLHYRRCEACHQVRLDWKLTRINHQIESINCCRKCCKLSLTDIRFLQKTLPTWIDPKTKKPQYHVPHQLAILREGEKLIIQRLSVYVPVHHLRMGQTACKGHSAAFRQDIGSIALILPRLPNEVDYVKVIKMYKDRKGDIGTKQFVIRKKVVLDALRWLKTHNHLYKNVEIQEDRLDWIAGEEAELPSNRNRVDIIDDPNSPELLGDNVLNNHPQNDIGPSQSQVYDVEEADEEVYLKQHGIVCENFGNQPEVNFDMVTEQIQQMAKEAGKKGQNVNFYYNTSLQVNTTRTVTQDDSDLESDNGDNYDKQNNYQPTKKDTISYPEVDTKPVDEFDKSIDIFSLAFPWLFPGGYGGLFGPQPTNLTPRQWLENCSYYEDGRFIMDKAFAYYALNFVNRHSNAKQGKYFINNHDKQFDDLESLQKAVEKGDTSWISKLIYFSAQIKGSVPYWRDQRGRIHTWINHHIAAGNGPPTLFITLSCAEYFWKDIERLLKERFKFKNVTSPLDVKEGQEKVATVKNVNNMTIIVQEYFQRRVENWLKYIGKPIFKINEHWLRYEFAPSRGQIHCHMLAITSHNKLLKEAMDKYGKLENMTKFLEEWMEKCFGMTAKIPELKDKTLDVDINIVNITMDKDKNDNKGKEGTMETQEHDKEGREKNVKMDHPSTYNCSDKYVQCHPVEDQRNLLKKLQMHKCSDYCLRKRKIQYV